MDAATAQLNRLLADLVSAGILVWVIRRWWAKQHKLHGAARLIRWGLIAAAAAVLAIFTKPSIVPAIRLGQPFRLLVAVGMLALVAAGFLVFLFPEIIYEIDQGFRRLAARRRAARGSPGAGR